MVIIGVPVAALISLNEGQENTLLSCPWLGTLQL